MSRGSRAWIVPLLLVALSTLATLGGFEVALRLAAPQKLYRFPRGLFRNDPERAYRMTPGFIGTMDSPEYTTRVRINSLGFRGPEIGPKPDGTRRVLVLGDSFVSALNVEEPDMFTSILQERLRGQAGGPIEAINAGTPGYGTWHALRVLREAAPAVEPDLVLLCVFLGNDLEDNLSPHASTVRDGYLVNRRKGRGILPDAARAWLQRHSMTYVFLWRAWDRVRPVFGLRPVDPLSHFKAITAVDPPERTRAAYAASREILEELSAYARGRFPMLVVLIPDELQVLPGPFHGRLRAEGLPTGSFDPELPNRQWKDMAAAARLPVLDLLPVLRTRSDRGSLYMRLDGHLTAEGNRVAAEAMAGEAGPLLLSRGGGR